MFLFAMNAPASLRTKMTKKCDTSIELTKYNNSHDKYFQSNIETNENITTQLNLQRKIDNDSLDLFNLHTKYGHIPFARLREMAKQRIIPNHHQHTKTPACAACMFGRATRKQWRFKTPKNKNSTKPVTAPGQLISIDILYSPTPGFIAQLTGILTKKRYKYAAIFVDHFSGYGYVHLQQSADVETTLQSKHAFELLAKQNGIAIQAYHADNGVFRANKWVNDCILKHQ